MKPLWYGLIAAHAIILAGCSSSSHSGTESVADSPIGRETISFDSSEEFYPEWRAENTIVFHVLGEPDNLHPTNARSLMARTMQSYIQGYLVVPDKDKGSEFFPSLVEEMPVISSNGLEFEYQLKDGITWDDGTSLSLDDVIFSLKAAKCPLTNNPHYRPYASGIERVTASSEELSTFTISMKEKNLLNVGMLTLFPILQESRFDSSQVLRAYSFLAFNRQPEEFDNDEDLKAWATKFNDHRNGRNPKFISGLGPYELSEWKPGQSLTLSRKQDHWSEKIEETALFESGNAERIIFKINRDPNSQLLEFKAQVYDGSSALNSRTFAELTADSSFLHNYNVAQVRNYNYSYLGLNCRPDGIEHKKLFNDIKVRKAVAHAIPYDQLNHVLYRGTYQRQVGPVSPLKETYNDTLDLIPYDQAKAVELLEKAGWVDSDGDNIRDKVVNGERIPLSFDLNYMSTPTTWKDAALMISESLYEIGIECKPSPMTFAVMVEKNRDHDFDAMLAARSGSSYPEDFTQLWHTKSWANEGSNYVGFGNQDSNDLIDTIKVTVDLETRKHLCWKFQEMVYEDMPAIFLFSSTQRVVAHKRYENVTVYNDKPYLLLNNWKLSPFAITDSQ